MKNACDYKIHQIIYILHWDQANLIEIHMKILPLSIVWIKDQTLCNIDKMSLK